MITNEQKDTDRGTEKNSKVFWSKYKLKERRTEKGETSMDKLAAKRDLNLI